MNSHRLSRSSLACLRRCLAFPAMVLAGSMFAGCAAKGPSDEGIPSPRALPMNSFQIHWFEQLETAHGPVTRLFARETLIICYTDDGTSYVLDRTTGNLALPPVTVRHGEQQLHPPVVLKDFIVYPTNTSLEVYDRANGDLLLSKNLRYAIRSDAVGSKTYVYFGADYLAGGRTVAVDVTSEYLDHRWELMFPHSAARSAPAVWGDIVYCAAENGDVAAVSYETREPLWPVENHFPVPNGVFHTYGKIVADLQVDEAGVYIASTDGKLCSVNRNNGRVKWQYLSTHELRETPVVTKDLVFEHVQNVGMVAIDKIAGNYNRVARWIAPDVTQILATDDKYVYVLRDDKKVVALDKTDGHAVFTSNRKDLTVYTTNPKDGTIFAITTANRVLAITPVLKPGTVGEMAWEPVKSESHSVVALSR